MPIRKTNQQQTESSDLMAANQNQESAKKNISDLDQVLQIAEEKREKKINEIAERLAMLGDREQFIKDVIAKAEEMIEEARSPTLETTITVLENYDPLVGNIGLSCDFVLPDDSGMMEPRLLPDASNWRSNQLLKEST